MKKLILSLFFLVCIAVTTAMAQTRSVSGTVRGKEDGQPIPGVSVKIKGTNSGVSTNSDGKYAIQVATGATLQFSSIGYTTGEVFVGKETVINFALVSADAQSLGEIVVTANAIKREKRTLGYSAPTVQSAELTEGGNPSAINSLAGRVAGVNISSSSNTPGSSSNIVLRGGSSIAGSNQALMVVDGVPIDNSSNIAGGSLSSVDMGNRGNDIDPNDIASITVLKGPAAAALYGSRASNGALIITTKTGSKNADKTSITFNTSNTWSNVVKLPTLQNEYGQGYYGTISADGKSATYINDPRENGSWGAPLNGAVQPWGQSINGVQQEKPYSAIPNNIKDFFDTGFATDNNLSFSGGNDKSTFFLGLNGLNSNGVFPGSSDVFNKYGVRFNGSTELSKKFTASVSFNYSNISSNTPAGGQDGSSILNNVLQTPRDIDLPSMKNLSNPYNAIGPANSPNTYGYYGAYTMNPYWILQNYKNLDNISRLTGNFNLTYKPVEWLNLVERVGIDTYTDRTRLIAPKYSFTPADDTGGADLYSDANIQTGVGSYQINQSNVTEFVHDFMATAHHKFGQDFDASLMVGNNVRIRNTSATETSTNTSGGLVVPGWYNLSNSNGPVNVLEDNIANRRLFGLYADLNLSYKNFLFLEGTARNDWSSTLPVDNQSFFYPSVSGSFVFSELLKNNSTWDFLSYGKIRSSYAMVGNDTDPYQLSTTYSKTVINGGFGNTTFPFGNAPGLMASSTIGNPELKPEKTTSFEVGTELGFLKNRLSFDFSYYKNDSKNQILSVPIPNSTGYNYAVLNAGEVQNSGVEISLKGTAIKTTDVTLDFFGTFTKNNSKVVSLQPGLDQISVGGFGGMSIVAAVGKPYGEFYAVTNATDAQGRTIVNKTTGLPEATGTPEYLGSYNPKYQASFGTSARYQHFTLTALFDTKQGGKFFSRTKDITGFNGTSLETGGDRIGAIFPNSVTVTNGVSTPNTSIGYNKQDYYTGGVNPGMDIVDASYIRLQSANISYTFTKKQLMRSPFGAASIGIYGNNLILWTPSSNKYADPEINSAGAGNVQGFDFTAQPSVRNYGINLKVSF
ncbi:SusC/RagA family TonB-linked outer membrane protein [Pedobacter sp. L105]|uniref:SusC/RagA family TonB-linked outer membrane protein n=1 Tax=Pedobacter sp. L105 TaxID=1641871 RepID=UPI00131D78DA|nr:SusC/RagA family TonB-linked outer membrane protein [Pedobacter sp. L105]